MHTDKENRISVRRPLAAAGFGWLAAQWLAMMTGARFSFVCSGVLLAAGLFLLLQDRQRKRRLTAVICLICAVSAALTSVYRLWRYEPVRAIGDQTVSVSGIICEEPQESDGRSYYTVQTDSLSAVGSLRDWGGAKVRLSSRTPLDAGKYDFVTVSRAYVYAPAGGFGYSSQSYFESRAIALTGTFSSFDAVVTKHSRPWYAFADELHKRISDALHVLLPKEESGLACGILLGEKADLSDTIVENFRACGISHLLVVSGLHLSFLIVGLQQLLERLLHRKRFAAALCLPVLLLFMAVVGFTPSVLRSGIMMLLYLIAILIFRTGDSRTSLAFAVWVICLANPCAAGDVGLQLSFLATLGIQCCSGRWCAGLYRLLPQRIGQSPVLHRILPAVCTTVSASLFTLPVTLASFGSVSLIAPLVNLFAELPAQLLLQFSVLTALVQIIGMPVIPKALALLTGLLARGLAGIAAFFAGLAPTVPIPPAGWMLLAAVGLLLAALCIRVPKAPRLRLCSVLLMAALFMGLADGAEAMQSRPRLQVMNVGGGLAVTVCSGSETLLLLSDCGGEAISLCSEQFAAACPDMLLMPGQYSRSASLAAKSALRGRSPQLALIGYRRMPDEIRFLRRGNVLLSSRNEQVSFGNLTVQQIPAGDGIWYRVILEQTVILIPTGECDAAALSPQYRSADVLVLGDDAKNLSKLRCGAVLVSAEQDSAQMLCSAAAQTGSTVYCTTRCGSLTLFFGRPPVVLASK